MPHSDITFDRSVFSDGVQETLTQALGENVQVYPRSPTEAAGIRCALARIKGDRILLALSAESVPFEANMRLHHDGKTLHVCPLNTANADELRRLFPWTAPHALKLKSAVGCGDRLGLATPGHIRACRQTGALPVLAQQSIREMERTGRSPIQVLNDATWAVFQEGYTGGFGADADHLKTTDDIDACFEAGYTMYTIDPSDYVDNEADHLDADTFENRFEALPWDALDASPSSYFDHYTNTLAEVPDPDGAIAISFDEESLQRAAVKYSAAIAHTLAMAEHLAMRYEKDRPDTDYDLEISVDETDTPTLPREHYFIAAELERLGVDLTSLAPRFTGEFQKGIDFIGDPAEFARSFRKHAAIARAFGGYKLSIHSGSDKFLVYPIIGSYAGDHVHLKTAGTSFLEALRIPARHAPGFFRAIVQFAFGRFEKDKKTYHVTTDLNAIPNPDTISDDQLEETYLDEPDARQLLHITYGSILTEEENGEPVFKEQLFALLDAHEEEHYQILERHFLRHIEGVGTMAQQKKAPASSTSE